MSTHNIILDLFILITILEDPRGRDSNGYGLDDREIKNFVFSTSSRPAPGPTQPHSQRVPGAFSLGGKAAAYKTDHSPPTSAEVKKI
jgi:hypothetical protein